MLPQSLVRSCSVILGAASAEVLRDQLEKKNLRVPSESTVSRFRLKLDASWMQCSADTVLIFCCCHCSLLYSFSSWFISGFIWITDHWTIFKKMFTFLIDQCVNASQSVKVILMRRRQHMFLVEPPKFYYLSSDSSMQKGGHDFFMTLEDAVAMTDCEKLYAPDFDVTSFNNAKLLQSTTLPAAVIGSGNASLPGKFEAFIQSLKLDAGLGNLQTYGNRIVSFVADDGTESKFLDVAWHERGSGVQCQGIQS